MQSLQYYKKLITAIIYYDYTYDSRPSFLNSSNLPRTRLISRFFKLMIAFPLSLLAWAFLRVVSLRYRISIYVLKSFRPGFASTYINMMEPLCRQLQHDNNSRHIRILVEPGEAVSDVLVKSYEPHFTMYLDDRRKFARLIAYLIPKSGLEKRFINTGDKYLHSWLYPPSKNYVNLENQVPSDLAKMGIEKENYVLFAHASENYYKNRVPAEYLPEIQIRFNDLRVYRQALEKVIENDLLVVRVGVNVDELPGELKKIPIIDYTGEIRIEASELWLYQNCKFLLSACSGAYWFARRFDRPSLLTNSYAWPLGYFSTLFTMMVMRSKEKGYLLSFADMIKLRHAPNFLSDQFMKDRHLEFIPNSPPSIANAVDDLLNLTNVKNVASREDIELMDRYKALLTEFNIPVVEKMTLPAISFLREHQNLF